MIITELIDKKAKKEEFTHEEMSWIVQAYIDEKIEDYQMSALLMAIRLNGLTKNEIFSLTKNMVDSGWVISFSGEFVSDKHSTGGVGDKVSLILLPLLKSLNIKMGKLSGRGLGFTGGTIDKLETIPGFNVTMSIDEFTQKVINNSIVLAGQTDELVKADKKLYALRDVTATVQSLPLIASSIMSKKIAAGTSSIVLDVKTGSGALMKTLNDSVELGKIMIELGENFNIDTRVLISSMDQPLGEAIGNSNELLESLNVLKGEGPEDVKELVIELASIIQNQNDNSISLEVGRERAKNILKSGVAIKSMKEWIKSQGGDETYIDTNFFNPKEKRDILANKSGYIKIISCDQYGIVANELGAGRKVKTDPIDSQAGINVYKKTGDKVEKGEIIATLYSSNPIPDNIEEKLYSAFEILENSVEKINLIVKYIK